MKLTSEVRRRAPTSHSQVTPQAPEPRASAGLAPRPRSPVSSTKLPLGVRGKEQAPLSTGPSNRSSSSSTRPSLGADPVPLVCHGSPAIATI